MCTDNVTNLYYFKNALRFDLRACIFKNFLGACTQTHQRQRALCEYSFVICLNNTMYNSFSTHKNDPPKLQFKYPALLIKSKKLANLTNRGPFVKIFLINICRYMENVLYICTDCCLFTKFFLANSFYLYGSQKFSPTKCFPCTVSAAEEHG